MKNDLFSIFQKILLALFVILLQTSFVNMISINRISPDLMVLFIFFISIKEGHFVGTVSGFLCGLSIDVYSPETIGTTALALTITGFFVGLVNERTIRMEGKMQLIFLFVSVFIYKTIMNVIARDTQGETLDILLNPVLPSVVYTTLFGGGLMLVKEIRRSR